MKQIKQRPQHKPFLNEHLYMPDDLEPRRGHGFLNHVKSEYHKMMSMMPACESLIDIGGHWGTFSMLALGMGKCKKSTVFEPFKQNFEICKANLDGHSEVYNAAVVHSDFAGQEVEYIVNPLTPDNGCGFVDLPYNKEWRAWMQRLKLEPKEVKKIRTIGFDKVLEIDADMLEMDCEGSEIPVLEDKEYLPVQVSLILHNPPQDICELRQT